MRVKLELHQEMDTSLLNLETGASQVFDSQCNYIEVSKQLGTSLYFFLSCLYPAAEEFDTQIGLLFDSWLVFVLDTLFEKYSDPEQNFVNELFIKVGLGKAN